MTQVVPVDPDAMDCDMQACCHKCGLEVTMDSMACMKSERHKVVCKSCSSIAKTLHRHLMGMPDGWDGLTVESQQKFFRECCQQKKDTDGPLTWKALRLNLVQTLTESTTNTESCTISGGFYPLSYWDKLGLDSKLIEQHGESDDHPILGKVYRCPIKTLSSEEKKERCNQSVMKAERDVKKRKDPASALPKPKGKVKGSGGHV